MPVTRIMFYTNAMTTFHPIPFGDLVKRIFHEYTQYGKIFGISKDLFFTECQGAQVDIRYLRQHASTPIGPASGPHTQLAQNIVLAWLTGSRIFELKTLYDPKSQTFPTPHIDSQNLGFHVERSPEISIEDAVREYVKAWMLIEIVKQIAFPDEEFRKHACQTIFELGIGYDYKSIKDERIVTAIQTLKNAQKEIDALRAEIPTECADLKDIGYEPEIIQSVILSTSQESSAHELDKMLSYLITEQQVNVIIKLHPTLLNREDVEHTLYKQLGYQEIQLKSALFDAGPQFSEMIQLIKKMVSIASSCEKTIGLKFCNTLPIKNHKGYLPGETLYMTGPPLHVLGLLLLKRVRDSLGNMQTSVPMSFSGGIDATNITDVLCLNLAPVSASTDLLKPPGYLKGLTYLNNLGQRMQIAEAINLPDYTMKRFQHETDAVCDVFDKLFEEVHRLGAQLPEARRDATIREQIQTFKQLRERVLNALKENNDSLELLTTDALIVTETLKTYNQKFGESFLMPHTFKELYQHIISAAAARNLDNLLQQALYGPYYGALNHQQVPEKLPSELRFHDCVSCGRCIYICPNNANFVYHIIPTKIDYVDYRVKGTDFEEIGGSQFLIENSYQIANFIDNCNECGVCGQHCFEQGNPHFAKPRYFGAQEQWETHKKIDGFFVEKDEDLECIAGRIYGKEYRLWHNTKTNQITFADGIVEAVLTYPEHTLIRTMALTTMDKEHILDMKMYYILLTQLKGVLNTEDCNPINTKYLHKTQRF